MSAYVGIEIKKIANFYRIFILFKYYEKITTKIQLIKFA